MGEGQRPEGAGIPLEPALEELRARLVADLEALMAAVVTLTQNQADWKPVPGGWSIGEVLHHVILSNSAFALAVSRLVEHGRREGLVAPPDARRSWPRLRAVADAKITGPVRNPDRFTPAHGRPIEQLRSDLVESQHRVVSQIPDLAGLDLAGLRLLHPLGFELNLFQWVDFMGAHERRHLTQIQAVMTAEGYPTGQG